MKVFRAELHGLTPYGQGRNHLVERLPRELDDAYDLRTWQSKAHVAAGEVFIPPIALRLLLESVSGYLKEKIPGRGQETYTKHYRQGIICPEPIMLGVGVDKLRHHRQFVPAQPSKPKSGRVWRSFPVLDQWAGELYIHAIDDIFTAEVIRRHLEIGGKLVGLGVWRPEHGGMWGKFQVTAFEDVAS